MTASNDQQRHADEADRRARRMQLGLTAVLTTAVIGGGAWALLSGARGPDGPAPSESADSTAAIPAPKLKELAAAARAAGCEVREHESEGDEHTGDEVAYKSNPPHSGDHAPVAAQDGVYEDGPAPTESQVHALEHGRVILQYRAGAPREVRDGLATLFDEDPYHLLLTENTTVMPYAVAATAWTRTLTCETFSPAVYDAVRTFKKAWQDKAPEQVP